MSEKTFRAVVAAVLVAALLLALVVTVATLYRPTPPLPSPSIATTPAVTPAPSPQPTRYGGPVFEAPSVVSVGLVAPGSRSRETLVLGFLETQANAIPNAPGSFEVILADSTGNPSTVAFTGTPTVVAPGSFGATATLVAPNVLKIDIVAADTFNVEAMTITGLGIEATGDAAIGPVKVVADGFAGSLEGGLADEAMTSPGSVVELQ